MKRIPIRVLKLIVGILFCATVAFFPTGIIWLLIEGIAYMFWDGNPIGTTWEWITER